MALPCGKNTKNLRENPLLRISKLNAKLRLIGQGSEGLKSALEQLFNFAMKVEGEEFLGVASHERSEDRKGYANGYKPKQLQIRMGDLDLAVPQVRDGGFYPQSIKLCGYNVSSSQISRVTKELDEQFEKFRDRRLGEICCLVIEATYLKIRHDGSVIDMAILLAYGVNPEGKREIVGISASLSEAEVYWREFFKNLQERGMNGVRSSLHCQARSFIQGLRFIPL